MTHEIYDYKFQHKVTHCNTSKNKNFYDVRLPRLDGIIYIILILCQNSNTNTNTTLSRVKVVDIEYTSCQFHFICVIVLFSKLPLHLTATWMFFSSYPSNAQRDGSSLLDFLGPFILNVGKRYNQGVCKRIDFFGIILAGFWEFMRKNNPG